MMQWCFAPFFPVYLSLSSPSFFDFFVYSAWFGRSSNETFLHFSNSLSFTLRRLCVFFLFSPNFFLRFDPFV